MMKSLLFIFLIYGASIIVIEAQTRDLRSTTRGVRLPVCILQGLTCLPGIPCCGNRVCKNSGLVLGVLPIRTCQNPSIPTTQRGTTQDTTTPRVATTTPDDGQLTTPNDGETTTF